MSPLEVTLMIVRYRRSKLSEDMGNEYKFCWRTFCMWDHSIFSLPAVIDQGTALRTEIKEMVREEKSSVQVDLCTRCLRYVGRTVSNLVVVSLLVGSGLLIYKVADTEDILPDSASTDLKDLFQKYQLTAVVAGLKFVVPPIFQQLIVLEVWHPRVETKITLARTTIFYIASLMVLVASLYDVTDDCASNSTLVANEQKKESCCWENEVGEEVFKVILVDLGLIIAVGSYSISLAHSLQSARASISGSAVSTSSRVFWTSYTARA
ncbi:hypothetical protein DPMN_050963 [Dreissena polymorpha]|uniref:Uncharacterized protein n=1 Tax=Dreissena polymorpha TaxID=45954 RepID=A0A9D4CHQ9_DREPO|nr:hypothetical protein DPMN_050963 [Dreissena polymorpha]